MIEQSPGTRQPHLYDGTVIGLLLQDMKNKDIAGLMNRIADLLEMKEADKFRIRAYRQAAQNILDSEESVHKLLEVGEDKLQERLPGVGPGLTRVIREYVQSGRSSQLERLEGEASPEKLLKKVPGIGRLLARRIISELNIKTLEGLEMAAHDGSLEKLEGFGSERVDGVRKSLAGMLNPSARGRKQDKRRGKNPPVEIILDIDSEYRERAEKGELHQIAPRRFNPAGEAWLPILKTKRDRWSFTALFSNTARAHKLEATQDWVVLYYSQNSKKNQCTVVTQKGGTLDGQRVIRGRERECLDYYRSRRSRNRVRQTKLWNFIPIV
jgi:hypothetical protein